ncbi:MAG TPA: 3-phosphoshikimate 1-carboxyvinyltransferase [Acidimicrobiales bacterium]|nr:3-phosphoshikimate 1-carboxyvinyltransferase [Acidimicrobiales bacterium]
MTRPAEGDSFSVTGGRPLVGTVRVPGDKSVSHRALLFGALAEGRSTVRGLSDGEDVSKTLAAVVSLGATVTGARDGVLEIAGGASGLAEPGGPIDCGNSGTTLRLLAGILAARPWTTRLYGDASLSSRPMTRVAEPLAMMGANVSGRGDRCLPPVDISGRPLNGIRYSPPHASSQVKSCVLLAGLAAEGETSVSERVLTRRHTEEMLELCGANVREETVDGSHVVRVTRSDLEPFELTIPGDPSQAAFWVVAACIVAGSEVRIPGVYVGEGRRGFLDVLKRMGADVAEEPPSDPGAAPGSADIVARYSQLTATDVHASEITGLDEVPVLAVAAGLARGETVFHDVSELRVKESDRLAGTLGLLRSFGASASVAGDDLIVVAGEELHPGRIESSGDHRMAMAGAVAALAARSDEPSVITGWRSVQTSYPRFGDDLATLTRGERR